MLGAIIGDMVGSAYEENNLRTKNFPFWTAESIYTDDTIMTTAVANACRQMRGTLGVMDDKEWIDAFATEMHRLGNRYPHCGYGARFRRWLEQDTPTPYQSFGNGSAMRVSPVAYIVDSLENCLTLARWSAEPSHNHPEGIIGAQAVAGCVWLAANSHSKEEIRSFVQQNYYSLDFTLEDIRPSYTFDSTCRNSVPQAITAFLESDSFEDAVRNAVSIGGDTDTIAAMAGSIGEAFYGIPPEIAAEAMARLPKEIRQSVLRFYECIKKKV